MSHFHHRFTLPTILTAIVVCIGIIVLGFINLTKDTTMPTSTNASAIGVNLNQDLGHIDLHKLQANGISFVYLRSTQGKTYFDDSYASYRDNIQGTNLAFGSQIMVSDESSPSAQFTFFKKKVGTNVGSLPIMLTPATSRRDSSYLRVMAKLAEKFLAQNNKVMIALNYRYHAHFPSGVQFLSCDSNPPNKLHYSFWQYTKTGTVKHVIGLNGNVVMYSYNGTVSQYKQKYGQLTQ